MKTFCQLTSVHSELRRLATVKAILFCNLLTLVSFLLADEPSSNAPPNVLMIIVDDLNDWTGCLGGHPQASTPNICALASRGALFTNAHCQAPLCGPSRASFLSGRYPHTTGMYQQPQDQAYAEDTRFFRGQLLPDHFAVHGYKTLGVGKIMHNRRLEQQFQQSGPEGNSGPKPVRRFQFQPPDLPWSGTQTDWGVFPNVAGTMPDEVSAQWAVDRLREKHDRPFFLAVGFRRPHVPLYAYQRWFDLHPFDKIALPTILDDDLNDVPAIGREVHEMPRYPQLAFLRQNDNEQLRRCTQAYLACTSFVDHQVGRVIDALSASLYATNTIIVLFSDHGYHLGEKSRVCKHGLWEEATHVPLIVVCPGQTEGSGRCARPVGLIDVYPTLLEMCGLPARSENDGMSLVPLLDNPRDASWRHAILTTYAKGCHALRSKDFRYIRYENSAEELYDHRSDDSEWTNLAGDPSYEDVLDEFRAQLPDVDAQYHPGTSPRPVNAWFADHYHRHGVGE